MIYKLLCELSLQASRNEQKGSECDDEGEEAASLRLSSKKMTFTELIILYNLYNDTKNTNKKNNSSW